MSVEARPGQEMFLKSFEDPIAVARYAEGPRRFVPGLDALHCMTGLLLAERAPKDAKVLVLGAGGGSELKALAEAQPNWSLCRCRCGIKYGTCTEHIRSKYGVSTE